LSQQYLKSTLFPYTTLFRSRVKIPGTDFILSDGAVAIAAITSCTNTSNPSVMLGAGLIAKKAVERGLRTKPWVKTSLAPGSRVRSEEHTSELQSRENLVCRL